MANYKPTSQKTTEPLIVRPRTLCEMLDIHISTLYRWHEEGNVPIEKINIGPKAVGYRRKDVEKWLNGEFQEEMKEA